MLLARLAIATSWQGKGLGSGLLKDAMLRTLHAAAIAAPTDPYHLFVLLKDVRTILKER